MTDHINAPGIYVHVPFCRRKCPYCDFYSVTDTDLISAYLQALREEIRLAPEIPGQYDTVYIGGGTPSLLSPGQIEILLESLFNRFDIAKNAEITLEVNPGTVSAEVLNQYRTAGINRLNVGVQSFNDGMLKFLGRIHSSAQAVEVIRQARAGGYDNLGLDLIYGLPGQTVDAWRQDLGAALEFSPTHLSCYMLTYVTGTPMADYLNQKRFQPLAEETCGEMFLLTHDLLLKQGYLHYEISNFACSDNMKSRHNQKYWDNIPYIGLGPSAHGYFDRRRYWNGSSIQHYLESIRAGKLPIDESETLTAEQEMIETVFLGLRCAEGIDIKSFEARFGIDLHNQFHNVLTRQQEAGYVSLDGGCCKLTREGLLYADSIAQAFVDLI